MLIEQILTPQMAVFCYLIGNEKTKDSALIDPAGNFDEIFNKVEEHDLFIKFVINTHGHFDHTLKVGKILRYFQIPLKFSKKEFESKVFTLKEADKWLEEGDSIQLGDIVLNVLETPGHSPGSLCFYLTNIKDYNGTKIDGILFS